MLSYININSFSPVNYLPYNVLCFRVILLFMITFIIYSSMYLTPDFIWKGKQISYNELTSEIPGFRYVS